MSKKKCRVHVWDGKKLETIEQRMDKATEKVGLRRIEPREGSYGLVRLYDPHPGPGFLGALAPLPDPMRDLAADMDGKEMALEDAVKELSKTAKKVGGKVEVVEEYKFIGFAWLNHYYRLIRYK